MGSLLDRIDELLESNPEVVDRIELLGEKACYLARSGDFDSSAAVVQEMRTRWGKGSDVRAMVWIMLAEGLIKYFDRLSDEAWDRIRRASSIARAASLTRLLPLTLAWLAHIEFFRSEYGSMGRLIAESGNALGADSNDVQLRLSMVVADATMYSGDHRKAQDWYERARILAVQSGDRISIGALIYNRSMLGVSRVLLDEALNSGAGSQELLKRYELELQSAAAFDDVSGTGVFQNQIQINLARARIFRGEYRAAKELLLRIGDSSRGAGRTISCISADLALCAAGLADFGISRTFLVDFLAGGFAGLDVDEQVQSLSSALKAARLSGFEDLAAEASGCLNAAIHSTTLEMRELAESLRVSAQ